MKALAQEVVSKFHSKLNPTLKLIVRELTGDMQLTRAEAESAHVIVTTPEKWDVVTRKSGHDENSLGNQCGLLIIDEVHLLADERGAVIESVVARLHRLVESRQRQVRIVGLSATLPNYQDVATFLQVPERGLFFFGPEYRPVPLQQNFIGVTVQTRDRFVRDNKMNDICYDVVVNSLQQGYQVMVFVHSRKGTGDTATAMADRASKRDELERLFVTQGKEGDAGEAHKRFADRVKKSRNREVGNHFGNGMGIHHAGMLRGDRKLTEQMFADGAIKVLCCTATLAWGINLPAHTVVVKGTEVYNPEKGGSVDLSILDVMQIFGRAGRPQFDTSGEATLITTHDALARYLDKLVRAVPIESNFIKQLADHLNAEVVGGTVTNIKEAATWLEYTYLYVRMIRNPLAYGITADQKADDPMLRTRSVELVQDAATLLASNEMVRYDLDSGNLSVTDLGRVAAHYYIQAESVATFNEKLKGFDSLTDAELSHLICCATEFENVKIRQEELNEIDALVKKACPLPVKTPVHESSDKSLVLMQAFVSRAGIKSFTLISDTNYIASNAGRVARALFEMCLKQNQAGPALKLLRIAKSVDKRFWWFQTPLRHFEGELKDNVFKALESRNIGAENGYDTFEAALSLLDMQHQEVGQLCHAQKDGGRKIQRFVRMLPRVQMHCDVQPVMSSVMRFHIRLSPSWEWQNRWHGSAEAFWVWVEDGENNRIYHNEYVVFSRRTHPEPVTLDIAIPTFEPLPKQYFLRAVSDSWVGVEMVLPVSFQHTLLPSHKPYNTDLMDLTPLPTTALQAPKYEHLYSKIETFNPIQTQLFHSLYHTDAPVLLGAPTGSGKTIVAELALLRMKRIHPNGICVYIAPLKSLARERLKEWKNRFGPSPLNWTVLELSGDTRHDQKALSSADVLVCTPEKWDLISRGWRGSDDSIRASNVTNGKAFVKRVRLLVIDEIHLLGEERGAVLEAIVSRTRFISKLVETEQANNINKDGPKASGHEITRIVGLSTALANPIDLADWIGIETKGHSATAMRGLYNFRPSVRPIPMEVHIQSYAGRHYCPRMATMNKPCYAAIKEYSPNNPTLIFVASRRQTRLTAMDLISCAASDENARSFLGCSQDYVESVAESVQDDALRHTMTFGIGLHHAGLSSRDRDTVERLFLGGELQVLVATATLAWGVNLPARFVIVKGTEYFDGKQSRYVDYPLTDVLQMIGRAGRPGFDTEGTALVMVETSKKSFYKKFLYLPFPVESCLGDRMCENLNAEIAIGTINSIVDAVGYLTWTFYARRVDANPSYYGAASSKDKDVESFLFSVVQDTIEKLVDRGCVETVKTDDEVDKVVRPTILGKTASNYYLQYRTPKQMLFGVTAARKIIMTQLHVKPLKAISPSSKIELTSFTRPARVDEVSVAWILYALSSTHEFDELPVRHNEEHLNAALSKDLMWGADTLDLIGEGSSGDRNNLDIMADPHTK
jgi:activating signal cointegrator complex subunit 3